MTRPAITVDRVRWDGTWPGARIIHRWRPDWPRRYVVAGVDVGWQRCARCGREHRVWITDDAAWRRLPRRRWGDQLCVRCFRRLVWEILAERCPWRDVALDRECRRDPDSATCSSARCPTLRGP